MHIKAFAVAALAGAAVAQQGNTSLCDKYTLAALKNNTAENQLTLLTLLVNTAVIGNYSNASLPGFAVPGILANGTYNGTKVNLLPYFNGGLASSNRGGQAVAVNFLDDGGAVPLMLNKPANGTSSNQYKLLTHLYEYFGMLLGCSLQSNTTAFKQYSGGASQYSIHQYMDLDVYQVSYFIEQVALAGASFGVTQEDLLAVGTTLGKAFNYKCSPPAAIIPYQGAQEQSICVADSCPEAANASCPANPAIKPGVANATLAQGEGNSSNTATASASNGGASSTGSASSSAGTAAASSSTSKGGAAVQTLGPVAALAGAAALVFAL